MESGCYLVVYCTCPDQETGTKLSEHLINQQVAACINILPVMQSIYKWNGKIESSSECLLLIKTTSQSYSALEKQIKIKHPYECPEIIATPIVQGALDYLNWVQDSIKN